MSTLASSTETSVMAERVRVSGIPVTQCAEADVLKAMNENIHGERTPQYIVITNTESMYFAKRLQEHAHFIEHAAFSCCDGVGVVAGRTFAGSSGQPYLWVGPGKGRLRIRRPAQLETLLLRRTAGGSEMMQRNLEARSRECALPVFIRRRSELSVRMRTNRW